MKTLGVIGGLGPMATAYFMELIMKMTDAKKDQEHLEMIILNRPSIPDRSSYIIDHSKANPLFPMIVAGKELIEAGAEVLATPCITAHYFHNEIQDACPVHVIHLIYELGIILKKRNVAKVGILATDGTIESGLFQKELIKHGVRCVVPEDESQKEVMHIIFDRIKAGDTVTSESLKNVTDQLRKNGAQQIILGCTELSLIKRNDNEARLYIDALEVLAACSIRECNAPLTLKAKELICYSRKENTHTYEAKKHIGVSGGDS